MIDIKYQSWYAQRDVHATISNGIKRYAEFLDYLQGGIYTENIADNMPGHQTNENMVDTEIKNWLYNKSSNEYKILHAYFVVEYSMKNVSKNSLREFCSNRERRPQHYIKYFDDFFLGLTERLRKNNWIFRENTNGMVEINPLYVQYKNLFLR